MDTGSFPCVKSGRDVTLTTQLLPVLWSRKSRAIPLLPLWAVWLVQSLSVPVLWSRKSRAIPLLPLWAVWSVQSLSVPVLWSRKSTAIPLLPLWTLRSVQSLSACTRVRSTFTYLQKFYDANTLGFTKGRIELLHPFLSKLYARLSGFSLYARHILNRRPSARCYLGREE